MPAKKLPASKLKRKRDKRPSAAKRGYDYQWQKSRKRRLSKGAKCRRCGSSGRIHFHHQPSGKTVPLCTKCHNSHTAKRGKKKAVGHGRVARTRKSGKRRRTRKK
jgi:hypothetical protein